MSAEKKDTGMKTAGGKAVAVAMSAMMVLSPAGPVTTAVADEVAGNDAALVETSNGGADTSAEQGENVAAGNDASIEAGAQSGAETDDAEEAAEAQTLAATLAPSTVSNDGIMVASESSQTIYVYAKIDGDPTNLGLQTAVNAHGWVTIGTITASIAATGDVIYQQYYNSGTNHSKAVEALSNVTGFTGADSKGTRAFVDSEGNLLLGMSYFDWTTYGLKTDNGSTDYIPEGTTVWHLDGYINANNYGRVTFKYVDESGNTIKTAKTVYAIKDGDAIDLADYKDATITKDGATYTFKSVTGVDADNAHVTATGNTNKEVTLTYSNKVATTYTVNYKWNGQTIATATTGSANVGDTVTIAPVAVEGYTAKNATTTYTVAKDGTVDVEYYKNVTLTSNSGSFPYDGKEHTVTGYTGAPEGVTFNGVSASGSQTQIGSSSVNFTHPSGDVIDTTGNYKVTDWKYGNVTVYDGSFTVELNDPTDATYNGTEQKKSVTVKDKDGNVLTEGTDYIVTYDKNVDAGTATVIVDGNGKYSGTATKTFTIKPAHLKVTTNGASKVYDGEALTATGSSITGLVDADKGQVTIKTTGSQTNVGTSSNHYEVASWGNAKSSNYTFDEPSYGTLEVKAQSINPTDSEGKKDPSYKNVQVSDPAGSTYNGRENKFVPEVKTADGKTTLEAGKDYTVTYKRNGEVTTDFTHAGTITVEISGTGNYSGTVTKTYTIAKKDVTITEHAASKVYDGTPLTADVDIDGIVAGETYGFTVTGTQTNVGTSENTYTGPVWKADGNKYTALESDYTIKTVTKANLEVTAQSINPADDSYPTDEDGNPAGVTVEAPKDVVYNGESQQQKPVVKDASGNVLEEGKDYTLEYSEDTTNAGTVTVTVKGTGNYAGEVQTSYEIAKRSVTVTVNDAKKSYDGTPLTSDTVTVSGDGFLVGDEPTYTFSGAQLNVGKSDASATCSYASDPNYDVTVVPGTLTVTAQSIDPSSSDYPKGEDGKPAGVTADDPADVVYDGQEHKFVPVVKDANGNVLTEGVDYVVTYDKSDFVNTGTIKVTIEGKGNYSGKIVKSYKITPAATPAKTPSTTPTTKTTATTSAKKAAMPATGDNAAAAAPAAAAGTGLIAAAALFLKRAFRREE